MKPYPKGPCPRPAPAGSIGGAIRHRRLRSEEDTVDSGINMHLAVTKLQDSLRVAEAARAANAVERPSRKRRLASLATAWRPRRRASAHPARSPIEA